VCVTGVGSFPHKICGWLASGLENSFKGEQFLSTPLYRVRYKAMVRDSTQGTGSCDGRWTLRGRDFFVFHQQLHLRPSLLKPSRLGDSMKLVSSRLVNVVLGSDSEMQSRRQHPAQIW
jgi:hypothetical protein